MTSASITVQWGAVDCIHHNGDITGYSVRYVEVESTEGDRRIEIVSGEDTRQATVSGLEILTTYTIEVAAVNSAAIGVYSHITTCSTQPSECYNVVSEFSSCMVTQT